MLGFLLPAHRPQPIPKQHKLSAGEFDRVGLVDLAGSDPASEQGRDVVGIDAIADCISTAPAWDQG